MGLSNNPVVIGQVHTERPAGVLSGADLRRDAAADRETE
jgi:hypothetical protein